MVARVADVRCGPALLVVSELPASVMLVVFRETLILLVVAAVALERLETQTVPPLVVTGWRHLLPEQAL